MSTERTMQMKLLRPLLVVFGGLSLITGLAYPLLTTGAAQALFPFRPMAACFNATARSSARG